MGLSKGQVNSGSFTKGRAPWNKGLKHSEETRKKMSDNHQSKKEGYVNSRKGDKGLKAWHNISGLTSTGDTPWNKGRKETRPEVLKRISKGNMGKPSWTKGKALCKETRIKISMKHTGDKIFTGFKKDFKLRLRGMGKYLKWRADVFKRDNYHCQECGEKGYLEAHHIIAISVLLKEFKITNSSEAETCKELWDIGNGISYCKNCHIKNDFYRKGKIMEVSI